MRKGRSHLYNPREERLYHSQTPPSDIYYVEETVLSMGLSPFPHPMWYSFGHLIAGGRGGADREGGGGYKVKVGKRGVQAGVPTVNKAMHVGVAVKCPHTNKHTAVGETESKWGDGRRLKKGKTGKKHNIRHKTLSLVS